MLLRVSLSFILLTVLPPAALHLLLPRSMSKQWRWLGIWLPTLVLLVSVLFLFFGAGYVSLTPSIWRTRLLTVIFCVGITELVLAAFLALGRLFGQKADKRFLAAGCVFAAVVLSVFIYGLTEGQQRFVTRSFVVTDDRIPAAFDDYRIAIVSDLHVGTHHGDTAAINGMVQAINATKPDLICIVGDVVNFSNEEFAEFLPQLSRLKAADGVISVMGNHDYPDYQTWDNTAAEVAHARRLHDLERQAGWHILINSHHIIHRAGDSIVIAGCENDSPPPRRGRGDIHKALIGTDHRAYRILLTHDPTHWRRAVVGKTDIPLTFSGHTHGMQFSLPGGWSPATLVFPEWSGLYTNGQQRLFVTTGIGTALLPMRLGAWPETAVCTLRHVGG